MPTGLSTPKSEDLSLTFVFGNGIVCINGEMSERFKEPVLKTGDAATHRGFESHSLRQIKKTPNRVSSLFFCGKEEEFEPIQMQMSGGHLLVAGLDGGNTIIFFPHGMKMQIKSHLLTLNRKLLAETC